jgi:hypothetical protein
MDLLHAVLTKHGQKMNKFFLKTSFKFPHARSLA